MKYIPLIVLLGIALLVGYVTTQNQSDGPIPNELSANRMVVYMVEDSLAKALETDSAIIFDYSTSSFFSSTFVLEAKKGQEEAFRKLINADGIADNTSKMMSDIEWDEESGKLKLEVSNGDVIVPVWLLYVLTKNGILNP